MTVSYAGEVPNGSSFGCFWKILWKWRGSVYKLVYRELFAYLCLYYVINFSYRFLLTEEQQKIFNKIRSYFAQQGESIPMSFVLGFYVSLVVKRWWEQYRLLPWPDTLALFISAAIPNSTGGINSETGRLMRRNIMRYMVLAYVITLQRISLRVKRRFPTTQHLVDAGLMHESEMKIFEAMNAKSPMSKYWMPLVWATNIINRARKDGLITSDHIVQTILMELSDIRRRLGGLIGYDTVCVPLVYTQVVTLVLYTYFIAALLGKQMLPNVAEQNGKETHDLYFPLFTVLQFLFYVGWLKVAEVLINPFGEDDDDIELNWLIDRHIKAAYMIVDEMHEEHPELLRDQYWECVVPKDLPYTVGSEHYRKFEPKGSAENYRVKKDDAMYVNIMPIGGKRVMCEDVYADYESVNTPMVERRKNNWLVRQLSRMGSMRSQSTTYSSGGGQYNRHRLNSVYSSPESGLPMSVMQQQQIQQQHHMQSQQNQPPQPSLPGMQYASSKPSLYEKFVHRKSLRAHKHLIKQNSKLNVLKARPRIPTPDAGEKSSSPFTFPTPLTNTPAHPASSSTVIMTSPINTQLSTSTNPSNAYPYPYKSTLTQDGQVLGTFLLSPIKEMDGSSSNNTLIPGHPATTALAQAIQPSNVRNDRFGVSTPVTVTTSNIKTLSIPFAVTSSSMDTNMVNTTLNIMPRLSSQISSITTTAANSFGGNDVITTIPLSLSIQHTPASTVEITEIDGATCADKKEESKTTAILSVKNLNDSMLKETEFGGNTTNSYVLERNKPKHASKQKTAEATNEVLATKMKDNFSSKIEHMIISRPAPAPPSSVSSLKKRLPDPNSGEVYV